MSPAPPVLDADVLAQLADVGGPGFLAELVEIYAADAPPRIGAMRAAAASGHAAVLASEAHALKSSSGNIGAQAVREICIELERMGRAGTLEGAADGLSRLELEYERALSELHRACREQD